MLSIFRNSIALIALLFLTFFIFLPQKYPKLHTNKINKDFSNKPIFIKKLLPKMPTKVVHAITAIKDKNNIITFWYGGSKEARHDVNIFISRYNSKTTKWQKPEILLTPQYVTKSLNRLVTILGNGVAYRDLDGRIWYFFVTVSVGGWSVSALNFIYSDDNGYNWSKPKQLITSPLLNISTLVRNRPFEVDNKYIVIPAYHESTTEFGELIWIDKNGNIVKKQRMVTAKHSLQPILFFKNKKIVSFLRSMDKKNPYMLTTVSKDFGDSWSDIKNTSMPNSDSAFAGLELSSGAWLLSYNNSKTNRTTIDLAVSKDYKNWKHIYQLDYDKDKRFGYPFFIRTDDGIIHLFYSYNRETFRHIILNEAWIEEEYNR